MAGPVREQPHLVLVPKSTCTGHGAARQAGRPARGHPRSAVCFSRPRHWETGAQSPMQVSDALPAP